eukprot:8023209-Pyramimonas_sp.AAC.1
MVDRGALESLAALVMSLGRDRYLRSHHHAGAANVTDGGGTTREEEADPEAPLAQVTPWSNSKRSNK